MLIVFMPTYSSRLPPDWRLMSGEVGPDHGARPRPRMKSVLIGTGGPGAGRGRLDVSLEGMLSRRGIAANVPGSSRHDRSTRRQFSRRPGEFHPQERADALAATIKHEPLPNIDRTSTE